MRFIYLITALLFCLHVKAGKVDDYMKQRGNRSITEQTINMPYDIMVSDLDQSAFYLRKAIDHQLKLDRGKHLPKAYELAGIVYYLKGAYDSSAYYNQQAIKTYGIFHDEAGKANVLCTYGYQLKRRDLKQAFVYYRQGMAFLEKINNPGALSGAYDNFGVLFEMDNRLDSAEYFYLKALGIKTTLNDSIGIPYSLNNLGLLYQMKGEFEKAYEYYEKAFRIRLQSNNRMGIAESFQAFGDLELAWKKYKDAIENFKNSNRICTQIKYPYLKQYNFEKISECYSALNDFKQANFYLKEAVKLKDSLLNEKNSALIIQLEEKFKSVEKDKNIATLKTNLAEKELAAAQKSRIIILVVTCLIIVIIVFVFLYLLQKRKAQAEKDRLIIAEREAGLKAVFDATEEERKRIAKDLHDSVGQQMTGLKMAWQQLSVAIKTTSPKEEEKLVAITKILDDTSAEVRQISHQMMPRVLTELGLIAAIEDMLGKAFAPTSIQFEFTPININSRFDQRIEISLYRVCQELVNNILKHSGADQVMVQIIQQKTALVMIVEDNGKGLKSSDSDGIGMLSISSRINTINGKINYDPGPQTGTLVTIRIPI